MPQIEGRNPVIECLKGNRRLEKIIIQKGSKGKRISYIINLAKQEGIPVQKAEKGDLEKIAKTTAYQGVIAYAEKLKLFSISEMLKVVKQSNVLPFLVILDHLKDPRNMGAIIRTAYASGANGLIFPEDRSAGITPVVLKASAGAAEHLKLCKVTNINNAIKKLKDEGIWIAGAAMQGAKLCYQENFNRPVALVIGSEGKGLKRLVEKNCDFLVKVPMVNKVDSLNASVAAGILFYEIIRQRS